MSYQTIVFKTSSLDDKNLLSSIPYKYNKFDAFVCSPQSLEGYKLSKLIKKGKRSILKDPRIIFDKKKHTINLHFNIFHLYDGLENSIKFLNSNDKEDFLKYVRSETKFFPLSIFILKKKFFSKLCLSTFSWLKKCEKIFGFNLNGYGKTRLYAFLAERFLSYWFKENTNYLEWPIMFHDIRK